MDLYRNRVGPLSARFDVDHARSHLRTVSMSGFSSTKRTTFSFGNTTRHTT